MRPTTIVVATLLGFIGGGVSAAEQQGLNTRGFNCAPVTGSWSSAYSALDIATWPTDSSEPWTHATVDDVAGCERCPGQGGGWQIPTTSSGAKIIYENPSDPETGGFAIKTSWRPGDNPSWSSSTTSVILDGYLKVTAGGDYRFKVKNREGAVLWVNDFGASPVVDNDGTTAARGILNDGNFKESNLVSLSGNDYVKVRMYYFCGSCGAFGAPTLEVAYQGPDTGEAWHALSSENTEGYPSALTKLVTEKPGCEKGQFNSAPLITDAAVCRPCPTGFYSDSSQLDTVGVSHCKSCAAGRYGSETGMFLEGATPLVIGDAYNPARTATDDANSIGHKVNTCTGECDKGHWCPTGSKTAKAEKCAAGTYGDATGQTSNLCVSTCNAGYYCPEGAVCKYGQSSESCLTGTTHGFVGAKLCNAGSFGGSGQSLATCSGNCSSGYYCPEGSSGSKPFLCSETCTASTCTKCSHSDGASLTGCSSLIASDGVTMDPIGKVYCPSGAAVPTTCEAGYYTEGDTGGSSPVGNANGIEICPTGHYCTDGVRLQCPAGRFGNTTGLTTSACSGPCQAGFDCPAGSFADDAYPCVIEGSVEYPEEYYCPLGMGRTMIDAGHYTVDEDGSDEANRYKRVAQIACDISIFETCVHGKREVNLQWDASSPCATSGTASFTATEFKSDAGWSATSSPPAFASEVLGVVKATAGAGEIVYTTTNTNFAVDGDGNVITAEKLDYELGSATDFTAATQTYTFTVRAAISTTTEARECTVSVSVINLNEFPVIDSCITTLAVVSDAEFYSAGACYAVSEDAAQGYPVGSSEESVKMITSDDTGEVVGSTFTVDRSELTFSVDMGSGKFYANGDACSTGTQNYCQRPTLCFNSDGDRVACSTLISAMDVKLQAPFIINSCSGQFSLDNGDVGLDYEAVAQYEVMVIAQDSGSEDDRSVSNKLPSAPKSILIDVINANEAPVMEAGTVYINENSLKDALCTPKVNATDSDGPSDEDNMKYMITSHYGVPVEGFTTDNCASVSACSLKVLQEVGALALNFERKPRWDVNVQATDPTDATSENVQITIQIVDQNDPPTVPDLSLYVNENVAIGTVVAAHAVTVTDNSLSQCTATDYADRICVVEEDTANAAWITFNAATATPAVIGAASHAVFTWVKVSGAGTTDKFAIDGTTGEITTVAAVNFEEDIGTDGDRYEYDLTTTDAGGATGLTRITIRVRDVDEDPVLTPGQAVQIKEGEDGALSDVKIFATDGDVGSALSWTVEAPWTSTFLIQVGTDTTDASVGKEIHLKAASALDFETMTSTTFDVTLKVTDNTGNTNSTTVSVEITDENDAPTLVDFAVTVEENDANAFPTKYYDHVGSREGAWDAITGAFKVHTFVADEGIAVDVDVRGDTISYSLIGEEDNDRFEIKLASSAAPQLWLKPTTRLDYDSGIKSYDLVLQASDDGVTGALNGTCSLTVNVQAVNEPPIWRVSDPYEAGSVGTSDLDLVSDATPTSVISNLAVLAEDEDASDELTFTIDVVGADNVLGGTEYDYTGAFAIDAADPAAPKLILNDKSKIGVTPTSVDELVTLRLTLSDTAGLISMVKFQISVRRDTSATAAVWRKDTGGKSIISYVIDECVARPTSLDTFGTPTCMASPTSADGKTFLNPVSEVSSEAGFKRCTDDPLPSSSSCELSHPTYENVQYSIPSNSTIFDINKFTGAISLNAGAMAAGVFDYERKKSLDDASTPDERFTFIVKATFLSDAAVSNVQVVVSLNDVGEWPELSVSGDCDLREGVALEQAACTITADDDDVGDAASLTWFLSEGDAEGSEVLDLFEWVGTGTSRKLRAKTADSVDYENRTAVGQLTIGEYKLKVVVKDAANHYFNRTITINAIDENEAPVFDEPFVVTIPEYSNYRVTDPLAEVNVDDPDTRTASYADLRYQMEANDFFVFSDTSEPKIYATTGLIDVGDGFTVDVDYEFQGEYTYKVTAKDRAGVEGLTPASIAVEQSITILVEDRNDMVISGLGGAATGSGMLTSGSESVSIKGGHLAKVWGDKDAHSADSGIQVTYGPLTFLADGDTVDLEKSDVNKYTCNSPTVATGTKLLGSSVVADTSNQTVSCTTSPGLGGGLGFNVSNGRFWIVTPNEMTRSKYDDAVISAVTWSPEPSTDATTTASTLTITGANFGPAGPFSEGDGVKYAYVARDEYDIATTITEFAATGCEVTSAASSSTGKIECAAAAGAGTNFSFYLNMRGFETDRFHAGPHPTGPRYAPPTVTSVKVAKLSTRTGDTTLLSPSWETIATVAAPTDYVTMDTLGGERLEITGTNFGTVVTGMDIKIIYGAMSLDTADDQALWQTASNCMMREEDTPHTKLYCETVPGVGFDMGFIVSIGGVSSAKFNVPNAHSYKEPILSGLGGVSLNSFNTEGGQVISLYGQNFGSGDVKVAPGSITAVYGKQALFDLTRTTEEDGSIVYGKGLSPSSGFYSAGNCVIRSDGATNYIQCETTSGTGVDHVWQLNLGGRASNVLVSGDSFPSSPTPSPAVNYDTSYGAPIIVSLEGEGAVNGSTTGGAGLNIFGRNFGPVGTDLVSTYGTDGDEYEGTCVVLTAHTTLRCTTSAGAGAEHKWEVTVDGQKSRFPTSSYAKPMVTGFLNKDGVKFENGLASGGEVITIVGDNFGPVSSYAYGAPYDLIVGDLTYGPRSDPSRYRPTNCTVMSHTNIRCLTAPGSGNLLYWQVTIKGQTSQDSTACAADVTLCPSMGYARPNVLLVSPESGPTTGNNMVGGFIVTITGTNFGDAPSLFLGNMDSIVEMVDDGTGTSTLVPSKKTDEDNTPLVGEMVTYMTTSEHCPLTPCPHHNVTFELPEGYGSAIPMQLLPEGGLLRGPAASYRYSYLPPVVADLAIQSDETSSSMDISIYGSNFGSTALYESTNGAVQRVLYNSTDISMSINATCSGTLTTMCVVTKSGTTTPDWDHNRIKIRVPTAIQGWLQVAIGDVANRPAAAAATWSQAWPALYSCEDGVNEMDTGSRPQIDAYLAGDVGCPSNGKYCWPGGWESVPGASVQAVCKGKLFNNDQPTIQPQTVSGAGYKSIYECANEYDTGVASASTKADYLNIECEYVRVHEGFNSIDSTAKYSWLPVGDILPPIDPVTYGDGLPTKGGHMLVIEGINMGKTIPGVTTTTYDECAYGCIDVEGVQTAQLPKVYIGEVAATLGGASVPCQWPRDPSHCTPARGGAWDVETDGDCCYQQCDLLPYLDPIGDPLGLTTKVVHPTNGYPRWVGPGSRVRVACKIPPGQGQLDVWAASAANIFSVEHKVRYAPPTVAWPTGTTDWPMASDGSYFSSTDGTKVLLNGTNLGFNPFVDVRLDGVVTVTELTGEGFEVKTVRSTNIKVSDDHTGLVFRMAPGQGTGHSVVLTVGDRSPTSGGTWTVNYMPPSIYDISIDPLVNTTLQLTGANFGEIGLGTHNLWLGEEECDILTVNHTQITASRYCSDEFVARCASTATDACGSYVRAYELLLGGKVMVNVSAQTVVFEAPTIAPMTYGYGLRYESTSDTNVVQKVYSGIQAPGSGTTAKENQAYYQYVTGIVAAGDFSIEEANELETHLADLRAENTSCCLNTAGGTRLRLRAWNAGPNPIITVGSSTDRTAVAYCRLDSAACTDAAPCFSRELTCVTESSPCEAFLTLHEKSMGISGAAVREIECVMDEGLGGIGDVIIAKGALKSSPQKIGYFKPVIDWSTLVVNGDTVYESCVGYCNKTLPSADGKGEATFENIVISPPRGGNFTVYGTNLGGFGKGTLQLLKKNSDGVMTLYSELATTVHTQTMIQFTLGQGEGGENNIILNVRGQTSDDQRLDYQHPVVTSVEQTDGSPVSSLYDTDPRVIGGSSSCSARGECNLIPVANHKSTCEIVIKGRNFGNDAFSRELIEAGIESYHVAQLGDAAMNCSYWTDTEIRCVTPEWQGHDLPVRVNVTGIYGDSVFDAGNGVNFEEPTMTSLVLYKTVNFGSARRRLATGFTSDGLVDTSFDTPVEASSISSLYEATGAKSAANLFDNPEDPRFVCPTEGSDTIARDGSFAYVFKVEGTGLGVHIPQYPADAKSQEWELGGRSMLMAGPNAAGQDTIAQLRHTDAIFGCPQDTGRGPYNWRSEAALEDEESGFISPAYSTGSTATAWGTTDPKAFKVHVLAGGKVYGQPTAPASYEVGYLPPTVTSVSPQTGPTVGNTTVTITGSSFGSHYGYATMFIGDGSQHPAMKYGCSGLCSAEDVVSTAPLTCCIISHTHTEIVVRTGAGIGGDHAVSVETGWGSSLSQNDGAVLPDGSTRSTPIPTFSYDAPVITSIEAVWPDRAITLRGTDLGSGNAAEPPVAVAIEGISCNKTTFFPAANGTDAYLVCLPGGKDGNGVSKYHVAQELVLEANNITGEYYSTCYKHTAASPISEYADAKRDRWNDGDMIGGEKCDSCPCDFNVTAVVGLQEGPPAIMQYNTPSVLDIRPNEPNAALDVLTITGLEFGTDLTTATDCGLDSHWMTTQNRFCLPNITVHVGSTEADNNLVYTTDTGDQIDNGDQGWYESDTRFNNRPILKVLLRDGRVGVQPISVNIASLSYTYNVSTQFVVPGCKVDNYGRENEQCETCPEGAVCEGGIKEPYSKEGFWQVQLPFPSEGKCPASRAVRGYCPYFIPCEPPDSCRSCKCSGDSSTGDQQTDLSGELVPKCTDAVELTGEETAAGAYGGCCAEAYTGERCALCRIEYYRINGVCEPCPKCPICIFLLFLLIAMGGGAALWVLQRKEINVGLIDIGIVYFQVIATFAQTRIRWPSQILGMYKWMSAFNLNLELLAPECSFTFTYETKWFVTECIPLIGFGCFVALHWFKWFQKRCIQNRRNKLHTHIHQMIGTSLILMYFGYLYITKSTLDIFNCGPTDPDDGHEYLEAVFVKCWEPGGLHMRLFPWSVFFFLLYCVGYPSLLGWILWRGKESAREDQLLRAQNKGDKRSENPYYNFRKRYHKLYFNYKPDFVWWILVILLRKFLISVITIIFRKNSLFQMAFMLLVLFAAYAVQVIYRPYMSMSERKQVVEDHENRQRRMHQDTHAIDAHVGRRIDDHHKKGKRNVRLGDTGVPTLREQGVATANYFFNYNTVEAVLLTSAILIALAGIMYESDRFDTADGQKTRYNAQKDALTAWVLMVIWGSILYWLTVVISEITLTINPELWQKKKEKEEVVKEEDEFEMSHGLNPLHHQASAGNDSAAIAEERLRKAQAEAALGRHKNVIDEQSREILELKKKVQASALAKGDTSTRRMKKEGKNKKTKKAFTPILGDGEFEGDVAKTQSGTGADGELFEGEHVI